MSVVGKRLENVRLGMGLTLRKFAEKVGVHFTLISHIEAGKRYPSKNNLQRFANILSLTTKQLEALIAVERRGLDPYELLPEIPPANIPQELIEAAAEKILNKFVKNSGNDLSVKPVPVEDVIKVVCGLTTKRIDFEKEKIPNPRKGVLYGCLYPDNQHNQDKLILVNTGRIGSRHLSIAEQRITVAHEAGHYVLHCGNREDRQLFFRFTKTPSHCRAAEFCPASPNPREEQANIFASCLLMPRKEFSVEWGRKPRAVKQIAALFGVTERFVYLRAEALNFL